LGYTRAGGFIAILLAGLIIDRLGAKPVMLGTLLIAGLSTIALAEVRSFGWIVAVMLLQASVGVVIFPTMLFSIARITTLHERGPFTSLAMGIAILVSVGVAPVIMGAIADRWSFEVGILLVGVATTLSCLLLRWIPKI
jgi:MFS family permease